MDTSITQSPEEKEEHKRALACTRATRWNAAHPERARAANKKWRQGHPRKQWACDIKREFGITLDEYDAMVVAHGGVCAICGKPDGGQALGVDHNHETGKVRGLLCRGCNTAIGSLHDSPLLLLFAIEYLVKGE